MTAPTPLMRFKSSAFAGAVAKPCGFQLSCTGTIAAALAAVVGA